MSHQATTTRIDTNSVRARIIGVQGPPGLSNFVEMTDHSFQTFDGQDTFEIPEGYETGQNALLVFVDGIAQNPATINEIDGNTIGLATPLSAGRNVQVKVVNHIPSDDDRVIKEWIIVSETEPANLIPPQLWFRPSTNRLKLYRENGAFEEVALISDFESDDPARLYVEGGVF